MKKIFLLLSFLFAIVSVHSQPQWLGLNKKEVKKELKKQGYKVTYRGKENHHDTVDRSCWRMLNIDTNTLYKSTFI